jgi:hypothetical protein
VKAKMWWITKTYFFLTGSVYTYCPISLLRILCTIFLPGLAYFLPYSNYKASLAHHALWSPGPLSRKMTKYSQDTKASSLFTSHHFWWLSPLISPPWVCSWETFMTSEALLQYRPICTTGNQDFHKTSSWLTFLGIFPYNDM